MVNSINTNSSGEFNASGGSARPLFTVVIPLYNKREHIGKTLASVLGQTVQPFEIVVVDDGSTDGGDVLVEQLHDARIRLVRKSNGGVSSARNRGIEESRSEWVAFLDADDIYHPDYIRTLAAMVMRHPTVDMVATQYQSVHPDGRGDVVPWHIEASAADEIIDNLPMRWLKGTCFFTSSVAVRLSLLKKQAYCFAENESVGEDIDLWFRLSEQTAIAQNNVPYVARLWLPSGLSAASRRDVEPPFITRMIDRMNSPESRLSMAQRNGLKVYVRQHLISLARVAVLSGRRPAAFGFLKRAARYGLDKRWLVTAVMALIAPGKLVASWQHWRVRRKMIVK